MTDTEPAVPEESTILVVDDDPVIRQALRDVLDVRGYKVLAVDSGEQALELLDGVDLVLLDLMLPGRSGWEICEDIKHLHGDALPVIIVTARVDSDAITQTFEAGADDYIAKPFGAAELLARVDSRIRMRRTQAELSSTQAYLQHLVGSSPAVIYTREPAAPFRIRFVTENVLNQLGFEPAEFVGSRDFWSRRLHPADADLLPAGLGGLLPGQRRVLEYRFRHRDGAYRWIRDEVSSAVGSDGSVRELIGSLTDITDTRRAQEALRQREEHFRTLIENVQDLITEMDSDGTIRYVSPSAERILGYGVDQVVGGNVLHLVHPDDHPTLLDILDRTRENPGLPIAVEVRFRHQDGSWRILQTVGRNLLDNPAGGGVIVNSRDVTDRRAAEDRLRQSEQQYRTFFEEDLTGDYICTPDGGIRECNAAFAAIFGYPTPADALGDDLATLFPEPAHFRSFMSLLREHGRLVRCEIELRCLDGNPVHVIQNVIGAFDDAGELVHFIGYMVDITERKALEEQLIRSQKLEAVGQLAGGIAHDFNNLLTVIRGNTALLLLDAPADEQPRVELEEIEQAATRATELTNQLLAFSRRQLLQPAVLNLNGVIAEMERPLRRLLGKPIQLVTDLDPELDPVEVDPAQLRQVLRNLAANARDAMPDGGTLTIQTANQYIELGDTEAGQLMPGSYAVVTVSDTGLGMSPDVRARAFEPFFTTKEVGQGTGLGLSSAYGIVEQSGGSIWLSSEQGEGTSFRIFFPVSTSAAPVRN